MSDCSEVVGECEMREAFECHTLSNSLSTFNCVMFTFLRVMC